MSWQDQLKGDSVAWLLEPESPGVRYLALRDLVECGAAELRAARKPRTSTGRSRPSWRRWIQRAFGRNPARAISPSIDRPSGRSSCSPSWAHRSRKTNASSRRAPTCWIRRLPDGGQFTASGAPSGTADCLQGNLCWALVELGCDDPRLKTAFEWMARSVTGEGVAPMTDKHAAVRYYAGKCGPNFACGSNNKLPCAWGAVKVMLAFGNWPAKAAHAVDKARHQAGR